MSAAQLDHVGTEAEAILCWRLDALVRAGFEASDAALLASAAEVDLHAAVDLVERGCSPALALRVLL